MLSPFLFFIFFNLIAMTSQSQDFILNQAIGVRLIDSKGVEKQASYGKSTFQFEKIITDSSGLKFQRNKSVITIGPHSIIRFVEKGLSLENGSVRFDMVDEGDPSWVSVQSEVAGVYFKGASYFVSYDIESAKFEVVIFKGEGTIQPVGRDETLVVKENSRGFFLGVMDSDGPAFDVFMKGHKATRGDFAEIERLNPMDLDLIQSKTQLASYIPPKVISLKPKVGEICKKPFAKFNFCLWTCVNNPKNEKKCRIDLPQVHCERKRCNANGLWSEESRLPASAKNICESSAAKISNCDY
jgi:hypothetical protein